MPNNYSRKGPKHTKQEDRLKLLCGTCGRETSHSVICSAEYAWESGPRDERVFGNDDFQIVECQGCETISFRHRSDFSEDWDFDPDSGQQIFSDTVRLYPSRIEGRKKLDNLFGCPRPVRLVYEETLAAITNELPILAGMGIGALLEAMCKERNAKGHTLEAKIDDLVAQGIVTAHGAEILHSLRSIRNRAAHEVDPPTMEELNIAFDVVEHALTGVYILPGEATKLSKKSKPPVEGGDLNLI